MKKVLVITGGTYISGLEIMTLKVLNFLKQNDYEITCCISGWNDGKFINELNKASIPYFDIKLGWYYLKKIEWTLDSFKHYFGAISKFLKHTKDQEFDCIYLTGYRQLLLLYPFVSHENMVMHVHEPNAYSKLNRLCLSIVRRKVKTFIAVSDFVKSDLIKCGVPIEKIELIYNGLAIPNKDVKIPEIKEELTIGIIGQLIERKGHKYLFEAVAKISKTYSGKLRLIVFGNGNEDYKNYLVELSKKLGIENLVFFRGFVEKQSEIYENINLTIVPSISEAFGLIAVESYFYNIPVIASDVGGLKEIIKENDTGFLVAPRNVDHLVEKIQKFIDDPRLLQKMGVKGKEYCEQYFSESVMINNLLRIFNPD